MCVYWSWPWWRLLMDRDQRFPEVPMWAEIPQGPGQGPLGAVGHTCDVPPHLTAVRQLASFRSLCFPSFLFLYHFDKISSWLWVLFPAHKGKRDWFALTPIFFFFFFFFPWSVQCFVSLPTCGSCVLQVSFSGQAQQHPYLAHTAVKKNLFTVEIPASEASDLLCSLWRKRIILQQH